MAKSVCCDLRNKRLPEVTMAPVHVELMMKYGLPAWTLVEVAGIC